MIFAALYGTNFFSYIVYLLFTLVAVYVGLVFHEVAHGLVALWNGDPTAKFSGRLSLNPMRHFDLTGFVMMMLVGFGYARPVPINPYNFKRRKTGLFTVAIAGIVMNIIIAFLSVLFYVLACYGYVRAATDGAVDFLYYLAQFFLIMATVNLSLAFFNLLPIFPLDGFRVVESFTRQDNPYCTFMRTNGQYIIMGLVALSFIISMASSYARLPGWFQYIDVLGTYLRFFTSNVIRGFTWFWNLMIPV